MSHEIWSRVRFLLFLVAEYNESHKEDKDAMAAIRVDKGSVHISIIKNSAIRISDYYFFIDLTEETVYGIYKKIKETDTTVE